MAYATVDDMVLRWGEAEMERASTPDGQPLAGVVQAPVLMALADASALIDSYLRKRYTVPLEAVPDEINRTCCILARYDLNTGGEKAPSEQAKEGRAEAVSWLGKIARGEVVLGMEEVAAGEESFAATGSRREVFCSDRDGCGDDGAGFGFWNGDR